MNYCLTFSFEMKNEHRFLLSTIEKAIDISLPNAHIPGTLCLFRLKDYFYIQWRQHENKPNQYIAAIFDSLNSTTEDNWNPSSPFVFNCSNASFIEFRSDPFQLLIYRNDITEPSDPRKFMIPETDYASVIDFVQKLLSNGIAVIGTEYKYCLQFYRYCHHRVFAFTPPHIQLRVLDFNNIESFWDGVNNYYEQLIIQIDKCNTLPKDNEFPLATAARAAHSRLMKKIDDFISTIPSYQMITESEYSSLFNDNGSIKDPELFKNRLYHEGAEISLLPKILPFVFGLYPLDSTTDERQQIDKRISDDTESLMKQVEIKQQQQTAHSKRITEIFRVITNDVLRTDRHLNVFKNPKGIGSDILTKFLKMFSILFPPLGYLQGMNDLFVPLILSYIPYWSEDSTPVDKDGNPIDYKPFLPKIFWCFEAMMHHTNHLEMLSHVTDCCQQQAIVVHQLLEKVCPIAAIWMRKNGLQGLLWCYSDFVLLFKRTFTDVWPTWLQFNCSPNPTRWLSIFMCSILIAGLDQLTILPNVQINSMMDAYPKILSSISLKKISQIALWLISVAPLEPIVEKKENDIPTKFMFFKTGWSQKSDNC